MNDREKRDDKIIDAATEDPATKKRVKDALPAAALVFLVVLTVGVAMAQSGNMPAFAGSDDWNSGLFGQANQGFDSQAYQLRDDESSDNKLQKDDQPRTEDTSVTPYIDQSSPLSADSALSVIGDQGGVVAGTQQSSSDVDVVGTGGTAAGGSAGDMPASGGSTGGNGSNPGVGPSDGTGGSGTGGGTNNGGGGTGDNGGGNGGGGTGDNGGGGGGTGGGGGGGSDPEPSLPSIIGDPGRVEQPSNPADSGNSGGTASATTMDGLTINFKPGYENLADRDVLFGDDLTSELIGKFLTVTAHYTEADGSTYEKDCTPDVRFGKGTYVSQVGVGHTVGDDENPVSNGVCNVRVIYSPSGVKAAYGNTYTQLTLSAHDHKVVLGMPQNTTGDTDTVEVWADGSTFSLSPYLVQVTKQFASPDDQGFVHSAFRGWSDTEGGAPVDTNVDMGTTLGSTTTLYSLGFITIPDDCLVRNIDGVLTLVGYTGTGDTITVPEGVEAVAFEAGHVSPTVKKLNLGSKAHIANFDNLAADLPNLESYEAPGSSVYTTDDQGNLYSKRNDLGDRELIRVAPSATDITLAFDTVSLNEDAFKDVAAGITITFESSEPPANGAVAIPESAVVTVKDSPEDITLKAYIAAWGDKSFALDSETPAAYQYLYDEGTVVSADCKTIEYVPSSFKGGYTTSDTVTAVGYAAFSDATKLNALTLGANVTKVEDFAFAGLFSASAMVVNNATAIAAQPNFGDLELFPPEPYEYDPDGAPGELTEGLSSSFMLYLPGVSPSSSTYAAWLAQLEKAFGTDAPKHISCENVQLYSNPADGSLYSVDESDNYTLQSVPNGVASLAPLPDGKRMTGVASGAFANDLGIKMIILPDTCTNIADDAFNGCNRLEVLFSQNTDDAAVQAQFAEAGALSAATLKAAGCANLKLSGTDVNYDREGTYVFYGSGSNAGVLEAVVSDYADGRLTTRSDTYAVAPGACAGCTQLPGIEMTPAVGTAIEYGDNAFQGCTQLSSFTSQGVGVIGNKAFAGCPKLVDVIIEGNGLNIGDQAFSGCNGVLGVSITGTLGTIGKSAFEGLPLLQTVAVDVSPADGPSGAITLGESAFASCIGMTSMTLKNPATAQFTFGDSVCEGCINLSTIKMDGVSNDAIRSIGDHAFDGCVSFQGFSNMLYAATGLQRIGDYAFYNCPELRSITFPETATYIGEYAYALSSGGVAQRTTSMGGVDGQSLHIQTLGAHAFENRTALQAVYLSSNVAAMNIGDSAFAGCTGLATLTLGNTQSIGEEAFGNCKALYTINTTYLPANALTSIGAGAFSGCSSLPSLSLNTSAFTTVPDNLLSGCSSLLGVSLPATVDSLGSNVFDGCTMLDTVSLASTNMVAASPDTFGAIDMTNVKVQVPCRGATPESHDLRDEYRSDVTWSAFYGDDEDLLNNIFDAAPAGDGQIWASGGLYDVNTQDGKTTYTLVSFDKTYTGSAAILNNTTKIADGAFAGCSSLMTIVFPAAVEEVGSYIFEGCTALEGIAFNAEKAPTFATDIFDAATTVKDNFRIYVPGGDSANWYGSLTQLERYKLISSGNSFYLSAKAIYTTYNESDGSATTVLSFLPKGYVGSMRLYQNTSYIADGACEGCDKLTAFFSRASLIGIGENAFKDCASLELANITNNTGVSTNADNMLSSVGSHAFAGCTSLKVSEEGASETDTGFVMPQYLTDVGDGIFEGCTSLIKCMWYSYSPIPNDTFKDCTALTTLGLGETSKAFITGYGDRAFMNCTSLSPTTGGNMTTTGNLSYVGAECFKNSTIALVALPSSIERIGAGAFEGCDDLEVFAFNSEYCPDLDATSISPETWEKAHVYVPAGTKDSYLAAWQNNGLTAPAVLEDTSTYYRPIAGNIYAQPDDPSKASLQMTLVATTKAALATYAGQIKLTNYGVTYDVKQGDGVLFPYSGNANYRVRSIPAGSFAGNQNLRMFIGGRFLADIGDGAFKGSNLLAADLARYTTTGTNVGAVDRTDIVSFNIGNEAFADCPDLAYVSLHPLTGSIGDRAFAGASDDLWIDCARNKSTSASYVVQNVPTLGDHAFGDTLPANLRITTYPGVTTKFIKGWAAQLKDEYGIDNDRLATIFGTTAEVVAANLPEGYSLLSLSEEEPDQAQKQAVDTAEEAKPVTDATVSDADENKEAADSSADAEEESTTIVSETKTETSEEDDSTDSTLPHPTQAAVDAQRDSSNEKDAQ